MFISELIEASVEYVHATKSEINQSNTLFAEAVNKSIDEPNMLEAVHENYKGNTEVIEYNKARLFENK